MTAMVLLSEWMSSQVEFWKPVQGFNGYDVSSFGRVRSWRITKRLGNRLGSKSVRRKIPKMLKSYINKHGYVVVGLGGTTNGKGRKRPTIHRLVAKTFIPNNNGLLSVNHLTGLKSDNRVDGLEWASRTEQSRHAWANGLHKRDRFAVAKKMVDARHDYREVPDVLVRMIRNMLADGISQGQIRRWSGLKAATIQSIAVGRTYRDVA